MTSDLTATLGPLKLKNPLIAASGVFGYGLELAAFCPPEKLGAVIVKGLSLKPWPGNPGPRGVAAAFGLVNAIGLENIGVKAFLKDALPPLKATGAVVGVNVVGEKEADYAEMAAILAHEDVDFLELNVSCPNVESGGLAFGSDPKIARRLTQAVVQKAGNKPVLVKLPPLVTDIGLVAKEVAQAGATAISLINSVPALVVNAQTRKAALGRVTGGLSGPPIKPLALRQVWQAFKALPEPKIPVVGGGGIFTGLDAAEFIVVGATAVQIGSAILVDPSSPLRILDELKSFFLKENVPNVASLRGTLESPVP
ncbi:MAG: dihydroorotate dehydrogenase [Deltaproteobacteria bacterium]|jgi:dihydroorotate dehydrogenase (NAD+) catalytic subunit|nr:dihydroorotate dehydrogenase [Deltaproteobacteria bacterium]